jgi:hypothetical protein
MNTLTDRLRDADPLRHEPQRPPGERDRLRLAVVAAGSGVAAASTRSLQSRFALVAALALIALAGAWTGSWFWSRGTTLQAAVRFEVRLAEDSPAAGLQMVRIPGSDRVIYLHQAVVVSNDDIAQSRVIPADRLSRFGISVEFTKAGAEKMRQATANHVGKPVAILIDGEVVAVPRLRAPIGASATISGDYTQAEAERIVNGMRIR